MSIKERIFLWSFNIGVLALFGFMTLGIFGIFISYHYTWICLPLIFIPKAAWEFKLVKSPFDGPCVMCYKEPDAKTED